MTRAGLRQPAVTVIAGPTAAGKTGLSLMVARRVPAEIVSADSRQIYRRMDIGTAKPGPDARRLVPHHCIDIADPSEVFNAGIFAETGRAAVSDILSRDRLPVAVGGSGLYLRALVDGLFGGGFRDHGLRSRLNREAAESGTAALHDRLRTSDPEAAEKIHPNDLKRIVRALEVAELSGRPMSRMQREETRAADFKTLWYGVRWPREDLHRRIDDRVDRMMQAGFLEEVRGLLASGLTAADPAMDALGYRELTAHLQGRLTLEDAIEEIKKRTRQFAKRQMTWFKPDSRIRWFDVNDESDFEAIAEIIAREAGPSG
ncbi:tRNA (adenosine(37)-N6)-dimethylallyltransferase MiaA [bacterium]|nr:tRNA (adenosine(37)-N6)-dimethylallyltransferase MiaA [bacterium]